MKKIIRLGEFHDGYHENYIDIFCKIKIENGRLSISGVEGPMPSGDCIGACGQINMHLKPAEIVPAKGWNSDLIVEFLAVWEKWHLNDMQAGTPEQMEYLEKYPDIKDYSKKCELLKQVGLYEIDGYKYGSKWLTKELPLEVVAFLKSLPDTDKRPAWV